ncbi:hypothetical protein TEA_015032 [Camellia sinensis var. sinensis]|uniref:Uncharacterized protein n=1 Tax=Camellia sinensis var. sinensis TaxID=542762 RepID=A0A4S4DSI5_CAMSN|nr:hypothetical protein TEA_015032 [Camellia sinensis var. sinensis]
MPSKHSWHGHVLFVEVELMTLAMAWERDPSMLNGLISSKVHYQDNTNCETKKIISHGLLKRFNEGQYDGLLLLLLLINYRDLSDNVLSGELPDELGHLTNLEYLSLPNNNFSGNLHQLFDQLKDLRYFDIRGNNFNGQIPAFIAQWKNIEQLYLMGNNFEWPVSHEVFQSLKNLEILQLADITGSPRQDRYFPIVNTQSLKHLDLSFNNLVGELPTFASDNLKYMDLSFNNLVGELPTFASDNLKYM